MPSTRSLLLALMLNGLRLAHGQETLSRISESAVVDAAGETPTILQDSAPVFSAAEFLLLASTSPDTILSTSFPSSELHSKFEDWKNEFERAYESVEEMARRKLVWLENHAHIQSHNTKTPSPSYTLDHNDFSDITNDEFQQRFYLGKYSPGIFPPKGRSDGSSLFAASSSERKLRARGGEDVAVEEETDADADATATVVDVPDEKNWVEEGAVTSVKNQWFCGACWAFSAVGAIEGARYIETGNLTELSMQQLIDCDLTDLGCSGGLMDQAFQYDEDNVGLCALADYPFAWHRHWFYGCRRYMPYCEPLANTKVDQFVDVEKKEAELKAAVATQPVSVAVNAGNTNWQFYSGGVYDAGCEDKVDHGILAVGYGHYDPSTDTTNTDSTAKPMDYWLVKNSWGETWGLNGYIQLARGIGNEAQGGSSCILQLSSRPILKKED